MLLHPTKFKKELLILLMPVFILTKISNSVMAKETSELGLSMSPMNQIITLNPGDKYDSSFDIINNQNNDETFFYAVDVKPFYVTDNYDIYYETTESYNQMADWISLDTVQGNLSVGDKQKINFTVNVPEDAPAGGQYAAIVVTSTGLNQENSEDNSLTINQNMAIAHLVYAEVSGTTKRQGELLNINLSNFMLSGDITGTSTIKNTGNVHGTAKYTLQVFPLFSNEEVYTNEEKPDTTIIFPNRTYYNETHWENTPPIGIFNVIYTVEFEGVTTQVSKMVIICPIWLLFIIIFAIIMLISYFVVKAKNRKKTAKKS